MIGIFSSGIWRIPHLENFLAQPCQKLSPMRPIPAEIDTVAVWGHRPSARKPVELARAAGKPILRLEDGFIRSLDLGVSGAPPLSMVLDDEGIYYDARRPSALERLIHQREENRALVAEAKEAIHTIVTEDLSKYNQAPAFIAGESLTSNLVLVVDQTFGDMSVTYGNAGPDDFMAMLDAAIKENPSSTIWVKVHPDVLEGKKAGYYHQLQSTHRVHLMADNVSPQSLLRHVSRVYVMTSQYGFEALMAGKPVTCFGQPWYAGWGLTDDRHPQAEQLRQRRGSSTLEELFAAAYLRYSRYIDPLTGGAATLFDVLGWMQLQRRHQQQRSGHLWAPGLTLWKSTILKPFLHTTANKLSFSRHCRAATACVVWGVRGEQRWQEKAKLRQLPLWRMEDGFLRSSGLGSDLLPPLSLVLDKRGIYYDATRTSDLEVMLNHSELTLAQQLRAEKLHQRLVESKLSKYNLGADFSLPQGSQGKRILLVPGQVEDDASIQTGTLSINTNLSLLRTVRERNPDAFIIYKPHPDVLVGNRKGDIPAEVVAQLADYQALDADVIQCIQMADELHTMTSLSGFEALLHGKQVHCYGMPFYAGWGLTNDEHVCARRKRKLGLADVIYQALIAYPTYIHPLRLAAISAEEAAEFLIHAPRGQMFVNKKKASYLVRHYRKMLMFFKVKFG
ncbi:MULTISPECIES: capsular polysaccharide biosynthesis protein [unclassified Pantoea]|uniref:capsular polysaccharide biosynthesis protein n=1 Tax=unclassified Pantoea TaxID=2630326 RepID=UPI001CD3BBD2|nr:MULTISPECIES: capsular polysaccharide biosynthesis protein [unclassified Pantoea]MCA1178225.1 capsular polysaccharide biosynthesis protein [Pantoea sp. alder69]MCA1251923.1 capsular polysaccharide biosynthesis protein [Pantoea sp. alder70]MCA1266679.1 capsular polysaccharide biosynthesis protein [Pantoea sp. alder81]